MKFRIFYILFLFSISSTFSQEKVEVDNGYEKGTLVDGYKEGLWSYYDNDTLKIQIDYSKGKLVYLAKDTTKYAILTDQGWEMSKLDIYPHYLGSNEEILQIIYNNLHYPVEALERKARGTVLLGFEINLQGKVENAKIIKDIGYGCGNAVLEVFKKIPDYWLVARKGKKQYKSRYILPVHFKIGKIKGKKEVLKKDTKKELKKLAKAKEEYSPAKYFPKIIIAAIGVTRSKKVLMSKIVRKTERFEEFPDRGRKIYR